MLNKMLEALDDSKVLIIGAAVMYFYLESAVAILWVIALIHLAELFKSLISKRTSAQNH